MWVTVPQARLSALDEQWQFLVNKSAEKSQKLKEANKQQNFNTGIKDFDFWLSEVRIHGPDPHVKTVQKMISESDVFVYSSGGSSSCLWGLWQRFGLGQQPAEETPAAGGWYFCPWGMQQIITNDYTCESAVTHFRTFVTFRLITNDKIPTSGTGSDKML